MTRAKATIGIRRRSRARTATRQNRRPVHLATPKTRRPRRKKIAPGFTASPASLVCVSSPDVDRAYDALVGRCRKSVRKALARIKRYDDRGDLRGELELELTLFASYSSKVVAAARARVRMAWLARKAAKENGTFNPSRRYGPNRQQVLRTVPLINLWCRTNEKVGIRKEEKNKGGFRAIQIFGLEHRARKEMIRMTLTNRAVLHPAQYAPAKGLKQAQRDIRDALRTGENRYAVTVDVKSYFNNIDVGALPELLRLPTEVIKANVDSNSFNIDPCRLRAITEEINNYELMNDETNEVDGHVHERVIGHLVGYRPYQGTPGISQGSSCSPIIAEIVMADILTRMPEGTRIFNWVDDILILARTQADAKRAIEALNAAMVAARGGRFQATVETQSVDAGFDFIGSRFKGLGQSATITPTSRNRSRLVAAMTRHLYQISHDGADPAEAIKSLHGWIEANSLWSGAEETRRYYLSEIERAQAQYPRFFRGQTRHRKSENQYYLKRMGAAFPKFRRGSSRRAPRLDDRTSYSGL